MNKQEILELMQLKKWNQAALARELEVDDSTVSLWISGKRFLGGPARVLLRRLLIEARNEARDAELVA